MTPAAPLSRPVAAVALVVALALGVTACTSGAPRSDGALVAPTRPASDDLPTTEPVPAPSASSEVAPTAPPPPFTVLELEVQLSGEVSRYLGAAVVVDCPDDTDAETPGFACTTMVPLAGLLAVHVDRAERGVYDWRLMADAPRITTALAAELARQIGQPLNIACPEQFEAQPGTRFRCSFTQQDGTSRIAAVTIADLAGNVAFTIE